MAGKSKRKPAKKATKKKGAKKKTDTGRATDKPKPLAGGNPQIPKGEGNLAHLVGWMA